MWTGIKMISVEDLGVMRAEFYRFGYDAFINPYLSGHIPM